MFLKMGLGALALAGLVWAAPAAAPGAMKSLHGHVPEAVSKLTSIGRLGATNQLRLAIGLPLRNQDGLSTLLQQISDPASQNYRHYLTPAQFTDQFGPTKQDYQALKDFAAAKGLKVVGEHPNRLVLDVSGPVANVETAFQVKISKYNHPKEARTFFAPDSEPVVDAALPVLHISGLDNFTTPRSFSHIKPLNATAAAVTPYAGNGPGGTFIGADFRKAYVPGTTLTGAGQNVGLFQLDGFFPQDPAAYAQQIGLANPPNLVVVPVNGGIPTPGGANGEVCLDIEMTMAMSPGVSNIYVYEGSVPDDVLNKMANDNLARQLSCSWGFFSGGKDPTADQIFQQMALQGQSFFAASGDSCAWHDPDCPEYFPQNSPYITIVGGTTLTTANDGSYASETVWNWGIPNQNGGDWGSSGGISDFYAIPKWQTGISMTANHGSTVSRNMPDVALTADNIYVISDNGQGGSSGGTSAASPLWAAFMALVNQQGALNGRTSVGFLNPTIYALSKTAAYTNIFRDTTLGNNFWPSSPTNFPAVAGYDLATGLGTPGGTNLINALAPTGGGSNPPPILTAPARPWGTNLAGMNGSNPNGAWFLFVQDDATPDSGIINGGWYVTLTTAYPVGYAADNQLYMMSSVTNAAGTYWPVTLDVTNYGPSSATNVIVTDALPVPGNGVTLVSSNATPGSSVVVYADRLIWTIGNLAISNGASLVLNFYAATNALGLYTNSATVNADTADPNPDDDSGAVTLLVSGAPTLPPQLTPAYHPGTGTFQLTVTGSAGESVIVQASTNLISWFPIVTNLVPFTNSFATSNYPALFYRAVVGP